MTLVLLVALAIGAAGVGVFVLRRLRTRAAGSRQKLFEAALKHLFEREYRGGGASFASLAGTLKQDDRHLMRVLGDLQHRGLVVARGQEFHLTSEGERVARQIVRAHRLLERYFADEARLPLQAVHTAAEEREHALTPDQVDALDAALGYPAVDPHGDPIPTKDGQISPAGDVPVTAWPTDALGRITHLEDEPPLAYAQIVAEGLRVGQVVRILEATPERIVLSDGDAEFRLAPAVAANVFLAPAEAARQTAAMTLAALPHGTAAEVVVLDAACQGFSRRRLMDLGFTPGARLEPALQTFAGDPRAYRVRGTLIALRADQARHVLVRPLVTAADPALEQAR